MVNQIPFKREQGYPNSESIRIHKPFAQVVSCSHVFTLDSGFIISGNATEPETFYSGFILASVCVQHALLPRATNNQCVLA